jgi:hypothetical protein
MLLPEGDENLPSTFALGALQPLCMDQNMNHNYFESKFKWYKIKYFRTEELYEMTLPDPIRYDGRCYLYTWTVLHRTCHEGATIVTLSIIFGML